MNTHQKREREVMEAIVAGHANKVIAADLAISPKTVEVHRARIIAKMQVDSLAELVRVSLELKNIRDAGSPARPVSGRRPLP